MERVRIVLGLGNPGPRYRETRHNLGVRVIERLAAEAGAVLLDPGGPARLAEIPGPAGPLVLAQPRTFMNRSGRAACELCLRYGAAPSDFLVVLDDADLVLGRLRIRRSGSAGGHKGLASVIETLGSDAVPRVRLGVCGAGRGERELADYVLEPFDPEELEVAEALVGLAARAVEDVAAEGLTRAMNRYNARKTLAGTPGRC
jgi:PTH1 family peptidyl-tRNA hydrolase